MAVLKVQALRKRYGAQEVAVLLAYTVVGFYAAMILFRRRLLK